MVAGIAQQAPRSFGAGVGQGAAFAANASG